ncbi:F0F1 ATP synthase subunit epsilon [Latilactobacillus fuchuensis]|uniref:ATP synthase epsilon chain n=1 Tax=Latilactobacillus fuchuensis DSM 14340 = JCM 11249 TaxID=1423747 RepID=A0A0R1RQZ5_9LACO|nr:F0F1 ATP synthase subunit epsilon [Latilactobacillus fuchuensis]KRL59388.1 atpC protein [Latilactobacillus fuchuensis DSM 14340 = JCM 11249]MCP8856663.1 F0F1 ATP synthase subunit epsilon [Latilactobacillus fuchuensis]
MAEGQNVLTVNIVTPSGIVYDHRASMVVVPAMAGQLGIMANHEPIITPLEIGELRVKRTDNQGHEDAIAVNGGFMEVSHNIASIVADSAERARDIDIDRAQSAKQRAETAIKTASEKHDTDELLRAQIALQRAMNRINVKNHLL